jgi:glucose/mannose transport system substrate-binding protein
MRTNSKMAALMIGLIFLAGCETQRKVVAGELEIFNWWTSGSERSGLEAVFELYKEKYPDVLIKNAATTGGAGTALREDLYERGLDAGRPPDTYQLHIGASLQDDLRYLQPITALYTQNGWESVFPPRVLDSVRIDGEYYSVPINIHRSNVLWFNKAIFTELGLQPPTTWSELFTTAATLQAAGKTAFYFSPARSGTSPDSWTSAHLFESMLLATLGESGYLGLFTGATSWKSQGVLDALSTLQQLMGVATFGTDTSGFDAANMTGEKNLAAMTIMGDWFSGELEKAGWKADEQYGYVASPDTGAYFMYLSDSFPLTKGAPNEENAKRFLELVGSREAQDAFNPIKGSIPARLDPDTSRYNTYLRSAIADFKTKTLVPSIAHGAAAPIAFKLAFFTIMGQFTLDFDSQKATDALLAACLAAGRTCN